MSGWGSQWGKLNTEPKEYSDEVIKNWAEEASPIDPKNWDNLKPTIDIPKFLNKKPTHDPYTNPNARLYYECNCGAIFDPGTKSFAQLNTHASEAGWKIRFKEVGYVPYCVKCGEDVE